jgi:hypothetical protein
VCIDLIGCGGAANIRGVTPTNSPGPRIATINRNGTGFRLLTHATKTSGNFDAAFTSTGRIIFTHYPTVGGLDLYTMNQAGAKLAAGHPHASRGRTRTPLELRATLTGKT